MTIIEAVAREICAADGIEPDLPFSDDFMGRVPGSDGYTVHARAAVLAVLNHLKDNVTPEMRAAGDPDDPVWAGGIFKAMLDQAIKEIEQ